MKKRKIILLACTVLLLASAVAASFTLAKFGDVFSEPEHPVEPSAFYLGATLQEGETYYAATGTDLTFTVRNHDTLSHVT